MPLPPLHPEAAHAALASPSAWITRWTADLPPGARVLDLACGRGRHARWLVARGLQVTALDRDAEALAGLAGLPGVQPLQADVEGGPWPLAGAAFDAIVVTNYLWRPLWPDLLASLAPGGLWLHETFALGHEALGRPSRPDFLLRPGELLTVAASAGLQVLGFEDGLLDGPPRRIQRIAAARPEPGATQAAARRLDRA